MRKRIVKTGIIAAVLVLAAIAFIVRVNIVNSAVPKCREYRYSSQETAKVGDFSVALKEAGVVDAQYNPDQLELQEGMEIVQCTLKVTYNGTKDSETFNGITCNLMSGAWHNGQNYAQYMKTNRENLNIGKGETKEIVLYFLVNQVQFPKGQYAKRYDRKYSIVFSTYPDAVLMDLGALKG